MNPGPKIILSLLILFLGWAFPSPSLAFLLSGRILEKGGRIPVATASLLLETQANPAPTVEPSGNSLPASPAAPRSFPAEVDKEGRYHVSLPGGIYRLSLAADGYRKIVLEPFPLDRDRQKDIFMERLPFSLPEVLVTGEKASKAPVSHETLTKEELASVPGTAGDVLRALQALPGVNAAGDYADELLVRGGGPLDNLFLLDRIPLAFPYHFGGLLSTLNSDLIKEVDFAAGGFSPEYGNAYGGLIGLTQRDARSDRWGGRVEVTPIFTEAGMEGPLFPGGSLSLSGRRSYLEVLSPFLTQFSPIPAFYDYQAKLSLDPSPQTHWDFQAFGSNDAMGFLFQNGFSLLPDNSPVAGTFLYHYGFDSQGLNYRQALPNGDILWETAYHTAFNMGINLEQYYLTLQSQEYGDRFDWTHAINPDTQLKLGAEYAHALLGSDFYMTLLTGQDELNPFDLVGGTLTQAQFTAVSDNISAFADQKFTAWGGRFQVSIGGRFDFQSYNHEAQASPRFSADYQLSENTTLKGSYGFYTQMPFQGVYEAQGFGNPNLSSETAASAVLGFEQKLDKNLSLRMEGYNKDFSQVIEYDRQEHYDNLGSGFSRGLELFLRCAPTERLMGWISYAFSDSERRGNPTSSLRPFAYDQPNVLTAVGKVKLTPRWDAGLKWHYATGLPYTPVLGTDINNDPIFGPTYSRRLPDYQRLDFSTSYSVTYDTWNWRIYLEVWNVTNHYNVLAFTYNGNYTQQSPIQEFPLLPYLGLEANF